MSAAVLWCVGVSTSALAAPPPVKIASVPVEDGARPLHLDLTPPRVAEFAKGKTPPGERRTSLLSWVAAAADEHAPASEAGASRPLLVLGRAETFVQRFGHEGLPLARLWEGRSAFVSLGLSPRGKPGLWLVQKTP